MSRWIALIGLVAAVCCIAASARGDDPPATQLKKQPSALDRQLLEDLGGDLLEGLSLPPASAKPKPSTGDARKPGEPESSSGVKPVPPETGDPAPTPPKPVPPADFEGEDVELSGPAANPLIDLGRRMKNIERLIAQQNTSAGTQRLQQQVVLDITSLIEDIRKQQKQPAGGSKRPRSRPGQAQQPGQQESPNPAEDSESRLGSATDSKVENRDLEDLLKEVWGHLPERVRRQMQSGTPEEVLPKYQKLIEEYYKRLAEDAVRNP
jgi:hypothetical protein